MSPGVSETGAAAPLGRSDSVLTTGDHKRIGRLYIGVSLVYLVLAGALGGLLSAERASTGFDVLDEGNFTQIFSLHAISAVFLFLLPAWIGLATYLVPLQVGARNIALPRVAAFAFWAYAVGGAVLEAAYLADGGPTGADRDATELWIAGFGLVVVALIAGLVAVITTVLASRAPGLRLRHVPPFSWSMLAAGTIWVLTLPVVLATLILIWIDFGHGGRVFDASVYDPLRWFFGIPQVYVLAVPAVGVAAEALVVFTGGRARLFPGLAAAVGGLAVLGFGAFTAAVAGPGVDNDFLYQAMGLAVIAPVLIAIAGLADIARRGRRPRFSAALVLAVGSVVFLVGGAASGMALSVDRLDLTGTSWANGQLHLVGTGAGTLGVLAALWLWAPKLWGARLHEGLGVVAALLMAAGTALMTIPDLVAGVDEMPAGDPLYDTSGNRELLSQVSGVGAVLVVLAVLAVTVALLRLIALAKGAASDPWEGGQTLEWWAASPPVPHNFDELPEQLTDAPLLDRAESKAGAS
jgi:heme/copper-type cytochrome/quinol oxidase subunit 1